MYLRLIKIVVFFLALWVVGHLTYTVIDGVTDNGESADIAVVLGSKVNEDGTLSERLTKRLECGLDLYRAGRIKKIIVSGGFGKEGFYEGDKMREFLVKNGVPDQLIFVDNLGNNTIATVDNALRVRDSLKYRSIIVVSQYFHLTRTKMLFRERGFENVSSVSPQYMEARDFYSLLREFLAYYTQ